MERTKQKAPSVDQWLKEAREDPSWEKVGMYLLHNGTVRKTARAKVRSGQQDAPEVTAMDFSYDEEKLRQAVQQAYAMNGVGYVRVWLNSGRLLPGEDIMYVLVGGDIRPHVIAALEALVGEIKSHCVTEREIFSPV